MDNQGAGTGHCNICCPNGCPVEGGCYGKCEHTTSPVPSPIEEAIGSQTRPFQEKDAHLVAAVLQKAVQTLKETLGEDFFCDHVTLGIQLEYERPGFNGALATKYMTMGVSEEQYLNLACYLTYMVGVMRSDKPENIEANLKITAKEMKHRLMKYNAANPYTPPEEDEPAA